MRNRIAAAGPVGFALVETLVTLALIVLLVGVIVPWVSEQVESGEPTRIAQELESVRSAVQLFRVDVKRLPGTPEQLVAAPASWTDSTDHSGSPIPPARIDDWSGPYLQMGSLIEGGAAVDTLQIGLGIQADGTFSVRTYRGDRWLTLGFSGITARQTQQVSGVIDGDTDTANDDSGGRIRWDAEGSRMLYLVLPVD